MWRACMCMCVRVGFGFFGVLLPLSSCSLCFFFFCFCPFKKTSIKVSSNQNIVKYFQLSKTSKTSKISKAFDLFFSASYQKNKLVQSHQHHKTYKQVDNYK